MSKTFFVALSFVSLVSIASVPVVAQSPSANKAAPSAADLKAESDVRELNVAEIDAFLHKNPTAMARIWSDDLVVTNPLNKFVTKKQVLEMMQSGFLVITQYNRQIEYARVYGDTVVVAGKEIVTWGGGMPNAGKTETLRFTAVWMKQGGRWQEVARHANIAPQA